MRQSPGLSRCGQLSLGGFVDCAANPTDICINTGLDDNCDSIAEQNPEAMQGVVNFASGMLSLNPITGTMDALGLIDTGKYADTCSGWYKTGMVAMIAVDLGPSLARGASAFRRGAEYEIGPEGVRIAPWGTAGPVGFIGRITIEEGLTRHGPDTAFRTRARVGIGRGRLGHRIDRSGTASNE